VYGQQEQSAYNGHFESTCNHPLLPEIEWQQMVLETSLQQRLVKTGAGEGYEKSLGMRHFRASPCPEKAELVPSRATELAREEMVEAGQEAIWEIPVETERHARLTIFPNHDDMMGNLRTGTTQSGAVASRNETEETAKDLVEAKVCAPRRRMGRSDGAWPGLARWPSRTRMHK
jgi:hypothetical protein